MTNFRELCDELLDELQYQTNWSTAEELKERARLALAEPEPEGPTDEELRELRRKNGWPLPELLIFSIARAVLARWGK